jgi:hypothetical protein
MSNQTPTPETDAAQFGTGRVSVDFARKLERERNHSQEGLVRAGLIIAQIQKNADELEAEVARLREDVLRWFAYIDPFELVDDDRKHFERWREEQALAAVGGEEETK